MSACEDCGGSAAGGVQPAPGAEQWCAGHNDGTAHLFNGHMTCHECGAVNWKACYHAVADSVQDDEVSAGSGSTDGAGTVADHIAIFDSTTAPFDPAEHYEEVLRAGLRWRHQSERQDERIDRLRRAVAGLRAENTRLILADLANDAQDIGTYGGMRDPGCGLSHPHSATSRCAGEEDL